MAKDFRSSVREIAATFAEQLAEQIVTLVQTSSMAEVFGNVGAVANTGSKSPVPAVPSKGGSRKRGRGADKTASTLATIAALLAKDPNGLRSEQIRDALKLDKATVTKALTAGLADKTVTKKGTRRATRYFAVRPGKE